MAKSGSKATCTGKAKGAGKVAETYTHPEETLAMRPEVGTQPQFRKKKPPKTYAGLGLAIPYVHNGHAHDYQPDFIVRSKGDDRVNLILETKGFDELSDVKRAAAERWVNAVNADGQFGRWRYEMARSVPAVREIVDAFL